MTHVNWWAVVLSGVVGAAVAGGFTLAAVLATIRHGDKERAKSERQAERAVIDEAAVTLMAPLTRLFGCLLMYQQDTRIGRWTFIEAGQTSMVLSMRCAKYKPAVTTMRDLWEPFVEAYTEVAKGNAVARQAAADALSSCILFVTQLVNDPEPVLNGEMSAQVFRDRTNVVDTGSNNRALVYLRTVDARFRGLLGV